ncbi:hypothetical protein ACO0RG_003037 [Hanseniaspora osmophila]|uniref:Transcriptional regulatory protein SAP30 n=1 Tax=Hanseniaspora osmophila TaxID=56408 RepID=A0A1E5RE93_9ASCO|nr:Transcriptional regulatory protein SAP30 [Hanseniaspora osmophila]
MPPGRPSNSSRDHHTGNNNGNHGGSNKKHSNENDSHQSKKSGNAGGHGSSKSTHAQQAYLKDLIATHVTNNHPDLQDRPHPLDFESYSSDFLRRYKDKYELPIRSDNMSLQGYLLGSKLGAKTFSWKKINHNSVRKPQIRGRASVSSGSSNSSRDSEVQEEQNVASSMTLTDEIIKGKRVSKKVLADSVKAHFLTSNIKESECIPQFIYKIKNDKMKFKMEF